MGYQNPQIEEGQTIKKEKKDKMTNTDIQHYSVRRKQKKIWQREPH